MNRFTILNHGPTKRIYNDLGMLEDAIKDFYDKKSSINFFQNYKIGKAWVKFWKSKKKPTRFRIKKMLKIS